MSSDLSSLSEDHVRQLGRIIETLEKSTFDFLQLEVGDLKVTVGKGNVTIPEASPPPAPPAPAASPGAPAATAEAQAATAAQTARKPAGGASGTVDIVSPILGMFYAQPEPGAPPFVTIGDAVQADTTVGLVEVMKTFNAVSAGVSGTVVEICASDAQLVEYGQVLLRVAPE